jgi:membrane fusion protein (multidrug efflux system)
MTTMPDDLAKPPLAAETSDRGAQRRKYLTLFFALLIAGAAGFGLWDWLVGSNHVTTDNAYVGGDLAQVTPQLNAAVAAVPVADSQSVKTGDPLVVLDDADARIALQKAEATLAGTSRRIEQLFATSRALRAELANRAAVIRHAQAGQVQARSAFDKATIDLKRREELQSSGAVSAEELTIARNAFIAAQAALTAASADLDQANAGLQAAQAQLDANDALIQGVGVADNPDVKAARAAVDQAALDLSRTVIRAPFDGVVAQRHVQLGQRVKVGDVLMSVVPIGQLYVDANFKESQLARVRAGQSVELTADLYGHAVTFHGTVAGFAGGTGASMAIIPAQNATGNWIKVVQRLPVRVSLDPAELLAHPLRVGLSMDASIDLRSGR